MISLTSILASVLFALGGAGIIHASPLGKIDHKPFNCDVCLGFWFGLIFAILYFSSVFIDTISDPSRTQSLFFALTRTVEYFALIVSHGVFGAGAGHYLSRAHPHFKLKKSSAPVDEV